MKQSNKVLGRGGRHDLFPGHHRIEFAKTLKSYGSIHACKRFHKLPLPLVFFRVGSIRCIDQYTSKHFNTFVSQVRKLAAIVQLFSADAQTVLIEAIPQSATKTFYRLPRLLVRLAVFDGDKASYRFACTQK